MSHSASVLVACRPEREVVPSSISCQQRVSPSGPGFLVPASWESAAEEGLSATIETICSDMIPQAISSIGERYYYCHHENTLCRSLMDAAVVNLSIEICGRHLRRFEWGVIFETGPLSWFPGHPTEQRTWWQSAGPIAVYRLFGFSLFSTRC